MKKRTLFLALIVFVSQAKSQELQAKLSLITNKVNTKVDKKIFQTLQTGLTNFLNNRKGRRCFFSESPKHCK